MSAFKEHGAWEMEGGLRGADRGGRGAFTLIELAVVTAVVAILVALVLPALARARARPSRVGCINNVKQVGLGFRIFANDNEERFPWEVPTRQGGSLELTELPFSAFHHFRVVSNELYAPKFLVCPEDRLRTRATNWASFDNGALSYFAGLDASVTNPLSILSGDRFLGSTRSPTNGQLTLDALSPLWWTNSAHGGGGNVAMGDGSVQQFDSRGLLQALRDSGLATNRLALPLIGP